MGMSVYFSAIDGGSQSRLC